MIAFDTLRGPVVSSPGYIFGDSLSRHYAMISSSQPWILLPLKIDTGIISGTRVSSWDSVGSLRSCFSYHHRQEAFCAKGTTGLLPGTTFRTNALLFYRQLLAITSIDRPKDSRKPDQSNLNIGIVAKKEVDRPSKRRFRRQGAARNEHI
jgi:hypothetical protein